MGTEFKGLFVWYMYCTCISARNHCPIYSGLLILVAYNNEIQEIMLSWLLVMIIPDLQLSNYTCQLLLLNQVTNIATVKKGQTFNVTISTSAIAPFVWLETPGIQGRFSDNGFLMVQPVMQLQYFAWELIDQNRLQNSLTINSLMDIYYWLFLTNCLHVQ